MPHSAADRTRLVVVLFDGASLGIMGGDVLTAGGRAAAWTSACTSSACWALGRLDQVLPVDELARRANMSRRNFDRRFREITGAAPATWLTHQRVIHAQRLLELTGLPVDVVARQSGFSRPRRTGRRSARKRRDRRVRGRGPAATFGRKPSQFGVIAAHHRAAGRATLRA